MIRSTNCIFIQAKRAKIKTTQNRGSRPVDLEPWLSDPIILGKSLLTFRQSGRSTNFAIVFSVGFFFRFQNQLPCGLVVLQRNRSVTAVSLVCNVLQRL